MIWSGVDILHKLRTRTVECVSDVAGQRVLVRCHYFSSRTSSGTGAGIGAGFGAGFVTGAGFGIGTGTGAGISTGFVTGARIGTGTSFGFGFVTGAGTSSQFLLLLGTWCLVLSDGHNLFSCS